jgi:hypothetical protein
MSHVAVLLFSLVIQVSDATFTFNPCSSRKIMRTGYSVPASAGTSGGTPDLHFPERGDTQWGNGNFSRLKPGHEQQVEGENSWT